MRMGPPTEGPLFPDDGPRGPRVARRVRGVSLEIVAFVLVTVLLPLLLLVAALVDLALWLRHRKPWVGIRLAAFAWWFLFGEMRAMVALLAIWIGTGGPLGGGSLRRSRLLYALRVHWSGSHLGGVRVLFGLRFEVEGTELAGPGPVTIMMRHASIIDNLLPDVLISRPHGMGLRFVIKRELQMIPTIDIGGRWAPTLYVRRASDDPEREIAALRSLADNLGRYEGILIYPEGTRFTTKKLARAQQVVAERQPEVAPLAARLRHILPPRLGGPLALLDEAKRGGIDIVFCGHAGFDGYQYISDIWSGRLVGQTIHVRFWRHAAESIPDGESERTEWLYARWQELDDWVGDQRRVEHEPEVVD
jgi:1-acyl-sn-glycerol-3-phosphate acyltransferase